MVITQLAAYDRDLISKAQQYVVEKKRIVTMQNDMQLVAVMSLVAHYIDALKDGEEVPYETVQMLLTIGEHSK